MATKTNPLDRLAATAAVPAQNFKIPPMPKLSDYVQRGGLIQGLVDWEKTMEEWRQTFERNIAGIGAKPTKL